jgi:preprotein translocase subunit SecA
MPRVAANAPSRNDKVTVRYKDGTVKKNVKFKTVEQDIAENRCIVLE